jgi:hypothetical protein
MEHQRESHQGKQQLAAQERKAHTHKTITNIKERARQRAKDDDVQQGKPNDCPLLLVKQITQHRDPLKLPNREKQ